MRALGQPPRAPGPPDTKVSKWGPEGPTGLPPTPRCRRGEPDGPGDPGRPKPLHHVKVARVGEEPNLATDSYQCGRGPGGCSSRA